MKKWTQQQEQRFQALAKEREEALAEMEEPLRRICSAAAGISERNLFHFLKANADEIRDALEPFDSGVRLNPEEPNAQS